MTKATAAAIMEKSMNAVITRKSIPVAEAAEAAPESVEEVVANEEEAPADAE